MLEKNKKTFIVDIMLILERNALYEQKIKVNDTKSISTFYFHINKTFHK